MSCYKFSLVNGQLLLDSATIKCFVTYTLQLLRAKKMHKKLLHNMVNLQFQIFDNYYFNGHP